MAGKATQDGSAGEEVPGRSKVDASGALGGREAGETREISETGAGVPGRPRLEDSAAARLAQELFGLAAQAERLPSDRDANFRLTAEDGTKYVLKVANAHEDEAFLRAQNRVMEESARRGLPVPVPAAPLARAALDTGSHLVRLVTWLEGSPLAEARPRTLDLARQTGLLLARMDTELADIAGATSENETGWSGLPASESEHPIGEAALRSIHSDFPWDPLQARPTTETRLELLGESERRLVERFLALSDGVDASQLPHQVIHGDANDYNILVGPPVWPGEMVIASESHANWARPARAPAGGAAGEFASKGAGVTRPVIGILDFGDLMVSARISEAAIAGAYLMLDQSNPLRHLAALLTGYHQRNPLSESEVAALFPLACARLCISVCMSADQRAREPENAYLSISEDGAWGCLKRLQHIHPQHAHYRLREACGFEPVPGADRVRAWIAERKGNFEPVLRPAGRAVKPKGPEPNVRTTERAGSDAVAPEIPLPSPPAFEILDFSVGSTEFDRDDLTTPGTAAARVTERCAGRIGVGRYDEARMVYSGAQYTSDWGERRTVHVGIDLFAPENTPVHAPLSGTVHSFADNREPNDYGPCLILEHRPGGAPPFWTLYGHLSRASLEHLQPGQRITAGQQIAELGSFEENGGWIPHLHFQLITDLLGGEGTYPGVAFASQRGVANSLSPFPGDLLGLPRRARAPNITRKHLQEERAERLGPTLSVSYHEPLRIVRGWMQHLFDTDGRSYLDAVNNVNHVGHSNPRVTRAVARQMHTLNTNTRYLHENILEYARRLTATLPDELSVCWFVNSGSEANDLAIRLARAATGRQDLIVLEGAYHGNLTTLIGASPYKFDGPGGEGRPSGTHVAPMPDAYRGPFKGMTRESGAAYAQMLDNLDVRPAAFLAESLPGCGGQIVPPPGYLAAAAASTRRKGGLYIADEVQTGFGRPGHTFWGFELQDVVPDIVVMGKPIGNGHPLGAVVTTRSVADAFDTGMEYFNTFGGNPVSMAAGLAVLDEVQENHLQQDALEVGRYLLEGLRALQGRHEIIGDVRGVGLYLGVELVRDRESLAPAARDATTLINRMREEGILLSTDGPLHNVIKIKPPMVFERRDADLLVDALAQVLREDSFQV